MLLKNIVFPALIVGAGFYGMTALQSTAEAEEGQAPKQPARMVQVQPIELAEVPIVIEAYGRMVSQQPVSLISEVDGQLLQGDVPFLPERRFSKGQILVKIDDRPIKLQIKSQKSALLNALARALPEIRIEYPNYYPAWQAYFDQLGFEDQLPPLPEAQNSKIKLFLSRFDVYRLYFNIRDQEIRLAKHILRAPFDGIIQSIELRPGSNVRSGSMIANLLSMEALEAAIEVPAERLSWIDATKPVTLTAKELDQTWQGKVNRIGKTLDEATQTLKIYVELTGDLSSSLSLFEGMFLTAQLKGKKVERATEIPLRLLYGIDQVFLVNEAGQLEARKVEVGYRLTETAVITGGLKEGELLVSEVLQGAVDGMPVAVSQSEEQI
jgi:hypothetical protein